MCFVCVVCVHVCEPVWCACLEKGLHVWVGSLAYHAVKSLLPLIVAGLGLCKVCIGLSGNSIHIQLLH